MTAFMRVGGRGDDTTAKPLRTDNNGNAGVEIATSKVYTIDTQSNAALEAYGELTAQEDASAVISKTAYVVATEDGYAGIDVQIGAAWVPLISNKSQLFADTFQGADDAVPNILKWSTNRRGDFVDATSFAKILSNKLAFSAQKGAGATANVDVYTVATNLFANTIIEFVVDEVNLFAGASSTYLNLRTTAAIPAAGADPTIDQSLMYVDGGNHAALFNSLNAIPTIAVASATAQYKLMILPTIIKLFRNGVLIDWVVKTITAAERYLYFNLATSVTASANTATVDTFVLSRIDASAKVYAGKPWIKTITDVVPGDMRVVFTNDAQINDVAITIVGQA